jgi:predicted peptidase
LELARPDEGMVLSRITIDFRERVFEGSAGNRLVADTWGNPSWPPVLFLHGGGQTRHS